jgi:PAS domain S-box-containing protein
VAVPDRDPSGSVIGWIACVADITSSKQAESRLAERNAQFDLAGKLAKIGSFTYDHATRKLQLSPGCAALYGLPKGTLETSRNEWRSLVHPDDLPKLDAKAGRALANGESEVLLEFRTVRHGETRWIVSRTLISYNEAGKPVRRIGAQIDVTVRKQAEQALAERNTQFELAHKAARVGSYTYDVSTGRMRFSRANDDVRPIREDLGSHRRTVVVARPSGRYPATSRRARSGIQRTAV